MNANIRFNIEGLQEVRGGMERVLEVTMRQADILSRSNEKTIESLRQQIALIDERNRRFYELGNPLNTPGVHTTIPGVPFNTGVGTGDRPDTEPRGIDALVQLISEKGIKLDEATIRAIRGGYDTPNNPEDKPAPAPPAESPDSDRTSRFLSGFLLSNIINPIRQRDPLSAGATVLENTGMGMMNMGKGLGIAGLILTALTGAGRGLGLDIISDIEPYAAQSARTFGGRTNEYLAMGNVELDPFRRNLGTNPYMNLGYNRSQVLQNQILAATSLGTRDQENLRSFLQLRTATSLSDSDLQSLNRIGRGERNFSLERSVGTLFGGIRSTGRTEEQSLIMLPEYLKLLTDLGKQQVDLLGEVNTGVNTRILSAFSRVSPRLNNPDVLRGVVNDVYRNLQGAVNPQVEALQFRSLQRARPGQSLWEYEKMRENPFSEQSQRYLPNFLSELQQMSNGTVEDFARNISGALFGGSRKQISEDIAKAFQSGNFNLASSIIRDNRELTGEDLQRRALDAVNRFDKLAAVWEQAKIGDITSSIDALIEMLSAKLESIDKTVGEISDFWKIAQGGPEGSLILSKKLMNFFKD